MEEIAPAHSGSHGSYGVFSRYPPIASKVDSNLYRTRQKGSETLGRYRGNGGILCSCLQSIYGHADIFLSNTRCSNLHPGTEGLPRTDTAK